MHGICRNQMTWQTHFYSFVIWDGFETGCAYVFRSVRFPVFFFYLYACMVILINLS